MSGRPHHFYTDSVSLEALGGGGPGVLLLGSYQGCSNFGDILQLKGAIRWHQRHTHFEPVMVVNAYLLASDDYLDRLRGWFGTRAILLWSEEALDAASHGLQRVEEPPRIPYLHLYGGGFLNAYWGDRILRLAEALHATFAVGHYVMSGQQVQSDFVPRLRQHLERCRPVLAGGRDPASADLLADCGLRAAYSFDDAVELLEELAAAAGTPAQEGDGLLVHLNASGYTISGADARNARLDRLTRDLLRLRDHLQHNAGGTAPGVTLLSACSDARVSDNNDTLSVILQLEDRFPFASYRVVDLARAALEFGTDRCSATDLALCARLGLSCSYHTAMFCNLLGVPTYLETANEYYRQKAGGLKMPGSLDEFLQTPTPLAFAAQRAARGPWLAQLEQAYAEPPATTDTPRRLAPSPTAQPWPPRASFWTEMQSLREAYDREQTHIAELTAARDRLWGELQQAGRSEAELRRYIVELEQARTSLEQQAETLRARIRELEEAREPLLTRQEMLERHSGLRIAALRAENEYLREQIVPLRGHLGWVEQQRTELWARVHELERIVQERDAYIHEMWTAKVKRLSKKVAQRLLHGGKAPA